MSDRSKRTRDAASKVADEVMEEELRQWVAYEYNRPLNEHAGPSNRVLLWAHNRILSLKAENARLREALEWVKAWNNRVGPFAGGRGPDLADIIEAGLGSAKEPADG